VLESYHKRAAGIAEGVLGTAKYTQLHSAGATRPQAQIVALALAGADVLPESPAKGGDGEPGDWLGGEALTSRERQIAELVARGLSNREIAERLVISKRTVDAHVNHIFGKLGLSSRVQLTIWLRDRTQAPDTDVLSAARSRVVT
jgi:non-specific serine/threonine protein kinase